MFSISLKYVYFIIVTSNAKKKVKRVFTKCEICELYYCQQSFLTKDNIKV